MSRSGSCLCGSVSLRLEGDPIRSLKCYCTECQKLTGSDHLQALWVKQDQLTVTGELLKAVRVGESGNTVENYFCKNCLNRVYGLAPKTRVAIVPIPLLDDISGLEPTMAIYTSSAMPWTQVSDTLKCYEKMPGSK